MKKYLQVHMRVGSIAILLGIIASLAPLPTLAAGTGTVTFDAVLDTIIAASVSSSRPLTTAEKATVSFKIFRDYGIRTEVVLQSGELGKSYVLPANDIIANPTGMNRDEYLVQYITKPTEATGMSLAVFTVAQGSQQTITLHFTKRSYVSGFDTTPGQPGVIAGENTSIATASLPDVVYDISDTQGRITDIFPLSMGSKKFIGAIESITVGKNTVRNILIFDATNPYKPALLKKNAIATSFDASPGYEFAVRTVANHNYFTAGNGIFKFDATGLVTLVKIDKTASDVQLLFRGSTGKIYAAGITDKKYIEESKNPLRGSVVLYDFSNPENGFAEVSGTTSSLNDFSFAVGDMVNGPSAPFEWGVLHMASKVIIVVPILQNIHAKHTGAYWIEFIDVTDIAKPKVVLRKKMDEIGDHEWNLTAAEKFYLSYTQEVSLFIDNTNKKLFDFYQAVTTNLAAGVAALVSPEDEAVARAGLRRRSIAASFSINGNGGALSFSQLSKSILCERIGNGLYVSNRIANYCGGGDGFNGVAGVPVDVHNGLALFLTKNSGARLGFFGNGNNGFSWIGGSNIVSVAYDSLKNPTSEASRCYKGLEYGISRSVSSRCLNGFIQQIDPKNFVVYMRGDKYISATKVVFANAVPIGSGGTIISPPTPTSPPGINPPQLNTTAPFSIQSLLKILTRFRRID